MLYHRELTEKLWPYLKRKEFIAILGPRQSGKTTFLNILRNKLIERLGIDPAMAQIVTFENRKLLAQFSADPLDFVQSYVPDKHKGTFYLFLDEFQYAKAGGQKLKLIYDTVENIKIIVTGSSSLDIKAQVGKYMVGRILTFHLHTFNFSEFLSVKDTRLAKRHLQIKEQYVLPFLSGGNTKPKTGIDPFFEEMIKHYEDFSVWGGYPAVVLTKNKEERFKVLGDIYNNYVLKDIKTLLELATENNLYRLSQFLAAQAGNIVVYQNLGQAAGFDFRNLKKHLNILYETFVCGEVRPFFVNRQKELSKNPKIYFYDTGFRNYLIESMASIEKRPDAGHLIENTAYIQLGILTDRMSETKFWRTKSGSEVDFVINSGGSELPIEVKFSCFTDPKIPRGIISFINQFNPPRAIILTKNYWGLAKHNKTKIHFIPIYYL